MPAAAPPPPETPPRRRRGVPAAFAALVILVGAVGIGIGHVVWRPSASVKSSAPNTFTLPSPLGGSGSGSQSPFGSGGTSSGSSSAPPTAGSGAPSDVASIAAKVAPALVDINSTFNYQSADGAGTGIVVTSDGEVLTNNHVVDGATKISVTDIGNHKTYSASVVGYDATHDIAVLKLQDASGLATAKMAGSSKASTGESVVAIGNAGGTGGTPSSAGGSVTALGQSISASNELDGTSEQLSGLIEVNSDVQAGDSGGSLVNSSGQVIGMDTAASEGFSFQSSGQSAANQGFAIPISQVLSTARSIESGKGSSTLHVGPTAFLGVLVSASGSQESPGGSSIGGSSTGGTGSGGTSSTSGATVSGVVAGGSAQKAGLAQGDVITSLNGRAITAPATLSQLLVSFHPGNKVTLAWTDTTGKSQTASVALGTGPPA